MSGNRYKQQDKKKKLIKVVGHRLGNQGFSHYTMRLPLQCTLPSDTAGADLSS